MKEYHLPLASVSCLHLSLLFGIHAVHRVCSQGVLSRALLSSLYRVLERRRTWGVSGRGGGLNSQLSAAAWGPRNSHVYGAEERKEHWGRVALLSRGCGQPQRVSGSSGVQGPMGDSSKAQTASPTCFPPDPGGFIRGISADGGSTQRGKSGCPAAPLVPAGPSGGRNPFLSTVGAPHPHPPDLGSSPARPAQRGRKQKPATLRDPHPRQLLGKTRAIGRNLLSREGFHCLLKTSKAKGN